MPADHVDKGGAGARPEQVRHHHPGSSDRCGHRGLSAFGGHPHRRRLINDGLSGALVRNGDDWLVRTSAACR